MSYTERNNNLLKEAIKIIVGILLLIGIIGYIITSFFNRSYKLPYLFRYNYINKKEAKEYLIKTYGVSSGQIKLKKIYYHDEICIDGCTPRHLSIEFEYKGQEFMITNKTDDENFKPNPDNWEITCVNSSECDLNGKKVYRNM